VKYPRLYTLIFLNYICFTLFFHVLIDYAAANAKRYVPLSRGTNVFAAILGVIGAITSFGAMETAPFSKAGSGFLTASFVLAHLKYIYAGVNLLGARFIPGAIRFLDDRPPNMRRSSSSGSGFL
jgi:hypothetical protein